MIRYDQIIKKGNNQGICEDHTSRRKQISLLKETGSESRVTVNSTGEDCHVYPTFSSVNFWYMCAFGVDQYKDCSVHFALCSLKMFAVMFGTKLLSKLVVSPSSWINSEEERIMNLTTQLRCLHSSSCTCTKGHLSEEVIFLVFNHLYWNPKLIAALSCACKWFDDLAKRVLWKEFSKTRAPKMMLDLQSRGSHSVDGNWRALGKLLVYCFGCEKNGLFSNIKILSHFVYRSRFSRTSGKSFLLPQCRTDILYVSDPCELLDQGDKGDIVFFHGIFKSFASLKFRKMLIERVAPLHPSEVCPYCKSKLWNMLAANMIPMSASCRLGTYEDSIEYYVCLNGHVHGICTLLPLSDTDEPLEE